MRLNTIFVGLGSNLSNPPEQIGSAMRLLDAHASIHNFKASKLYFSKPLGPQDQPDFCNAVVAFQSVLSPHLILDLLQWLERKHKRVRRRRWGERILDADLLFYSNLCLHSKRLTLPHPHALERDFVVRPMIELVGESYEVDNYNLKHWLTQCTPHII